VFTMLAMFSVSLKTVFPVHILLTDCIRNQRRLSFTEPSAECLEFTAQRELFSMCKMPAAGLSSQP
jgi:hypothetical protein